MGNVTGNKKMTMLDHALMLAKKGFHVFPVRPKAKFPPGIDDFPNKASRDEKQIKAWWTNGHSNSNIGISTTHFNESEALIVVDIDQKEGKMGENELLKLELEGLDFPTTAETRTPSGGRHLFYKTKVPVKQGVNVLAPGIDIRSRGGYVVGPGSVLSNGAYVLGNGEISEAPEWLVSRCGRSTPKSNHEHAPTFEVNRENAYSRGRYYLQTEAPLAVQGAGGDQTTFQVAARLKDFGVGTGDALDLMLDVWNNRCEPPWETAELASKIQNAYRYGEKPVGVDSPEAVFTVIKNEGEKKKESGLKEKYLHEIKPNFKQEFLVEKLLTPKAVSIIYGESGAGKTFFTIDLSLHIALGQPWRDKRVKSGVVIYIAAEGSFGVQKRILAFKKHHKIEERTDIPFVLVDNTIDLKKDTKELLELIKRVETKVNQKTVLIVIDTLMRAFGDGNENDAKDMGSFIKGIDFLKESTSAHILVVHHSGKDSAKGMRGHSSLKAAIDTEIVIEDDTAKVKKQRDMDQCKNMEFRLEQIQVGTDLDGLPVYSCVVLPANTSALADFSKIPLDPSSLSGKGLTALQNAIDWHPHPAPDDLELPEDTFIASLEDWREQFYQLAYPGKEKKKSWYEAFTRMVDKLIKSGHVKVANNMAYFG